MNQCTTQITVTRLKLGFNPQVTGKEEKKTQKYEYNLLLDLVFVSFSQIVLICGLIFSASSLTQNQHSIVI